MKMRIVSILALAASAGCAAVPGGGFGPTPSEPSALDAYLIPGTRYNTGYAFDLNRDAYVAVFRISPRSGSTLIYPRPGLGRVDRLTNEGLTYVPGRLTRFASHYPPGLPTGHVSQPDYYLLIASETPLDMSSVGPFGDGLRFALGTAGSQLQSPHVTMERLVSMVVPNPDQNNWATDFYVDWPDVLRSTPSQGYVRITCGDMQAYVPAAFLDEALDTLCADQKPQTEEPTDSSETATPVRRPPSLRDRIESRQLEEPRAFEARMRQAGRFLDDRTFAGTSTDFEPIDRTNRLRRSGDGPGVNRRIGDVRDDIGRPSIDRSGRGSSTGRAEPRASSQSRGSSGGGAARPASNSNPEVKARS